MKRAAFASVAAAMLVTAVALIAVAARGSSQPHSMDERVQQVATTLRCPVCRDLSVADSPSLVARQMRDAIARRLRAGQSPGQIRDYFVSRFGETVLLTPSGNGVDLLAWIGPVVLFAGGLVLLIASLRRWRAEPEAAAAQGEVTDDDRAMLARELEREDAR
jgi:cytochrome c-type biogenesis protein CcmH